MSASVASRAPVMAMVQNYIMQSTLINHSGYVHCCLADWLMNGKRSNVSVWQ